jgi:hypothetical protein
MGGASYSEMRSAYEVTNAVKNWEVIVGKNFSYLWQTHTMTFLVVLFYNSNDILIIDFFSD